MTLIVDSYALLAQADRNEPFHQAVGEILRSERSPLVVSAFAAAEADYMILARLGVDAELAFLEDLASETYRVEALSREELSIALDVGRQYRDLELGLTDLSLVVLALRFSTDRILTNDLRAFRAVRPLQGGSFTLLPADA